MDIEQQEQLNETEELVLVKEQESNITIHAQGLQKHFRFRGEQIAAVDAVSFRLRKGQFAAITGPSGSGKTTLLYLLGALDRADSGTLIVDAVNLMGISKAKETQFRRKHVGFVFQSFNLIPNLSALENVLLPMYLAGTKKGNAARERACDLLEQVGLPVERIGHRPGKLSAGQQQRVAIARALANDPQVILADEPTGNLDSKNSKRIIDLLKQLAQQGKTVVIVTHDRSIANQADVRMEITDGRLEMTLSKALKASK